VTTPSVATPGATTLATGRSLGLLVCTRCRATVRAIGGRQSLCPRCEAPLFVRRPHSLSTTAALVITAAVLYIPANLLPVMRTHEILSDEDDTILSGVISLAHQGSWPIALLVFFASIVVPLLKLFRLVEFVGRWSMLDVFALSLLASLVQIQSLAIVQVRPGVFAFAAVVVLTMLAAQSFDERLLWDAATHG
jgi:paraquat-inducible protein A